MTKALRAEMSDSSEMPRLEFRDEDPWQMVKDVCLKMRNMFSNDGHWYTNLIIFDNIIDNIIDIGCSLVVQLCAVISGKRQNTSHVLSIPGSQLLHHWYPGRLALGPSQHGGFFARAPALALDDLKE